MIPLFGFAFLLLAPGVAIRYGVLPFEFRFQALLLVSGLVIALCAVAGFSLAELGLGRPLALRHWAGCGALTLALAGSVLLESRYLAAAHPPFDWIGFSPSMCSVQPLSGGHMPIDSETDRGSAANERAKLRFIFLRRFFVDAQRLWRSHAARQTFFAGLAWATAYLFTRNIWPLIFSHAAVGTLAFCLGVA